MNLRYTNWSGGMPRTWLGRITTALVGAAVVLMALYFLFFIVLTALFITSCFAVKLLWRSMRIRKQAANMPGVLEGEYTVVNHAGKIEERVAHMR